MSLSTFFQARNKAVTKQDKPLFIIPKQRPILTNKIQQPTKSKPSKPSEKIYYNQDKVQTKNDQVQPNNKKPIVQNQSIKEQEKQNLQATIFVGNVNINSKHKDLMKHFNKYGKIEKVWFRSIPVEENKIGKKASHILKKYIEGADSMNAYVKFQKVDQAKNACSENGSLFNDLTIRVTMCLQKDIDFKSTIFVGNLPHQIKQEQVRKHFQNIGKIISVRVIKNKHTNQGIGIGYVHFETTEEMKKAIKQMNGTQLKGRQLRVKKAVQKQRLQKKFNKINNSYQRKNQINPKLKQKKMKFIQQRIKRRQLQSDRKIRRSENALGKVKGEQQKKISVNKTKFIKKV